VGQPQCGFDEKRRPKMIYETLEQALRFTANAAIADHAGRRQAIRACRETPGAYTNYYDSQEAAARREACTAQVDRVTVNASVGGNSRRQHVRHTFKIDGKRATRAAVEALLSQEA
jgi:hypothetical protein